MFGILVDDSVTNPRWGRRERESVKEERPNPELVTITPEMAQRWLATIPGYQRKLNQKRVEAFARDMAAGNWRVTHQGIAFDVDGALADGQTRLSAVVKSGATIRAYVFRGLPRESVQQIDTGKSRTVADSIKVAGMAQVTEVHVAIAQLLIAAHITHAKTTPTATEVANFIRQHAEAIQFGVDVFGRSTRRGITSAPVRAAIAVAYENDTDQANELRRFARILYEGIPDDGSLDTSAIKLRDFCQLRGIGQSAGHSARVDFYKRAQRSIKAFLERQPLAKIYSPKEFIFTPKGL